MYDAASLSDSAHQRAQGELRVDLRLRDGITAIADLRQQGCLKARFPRPVDWTEVVTLNTSGGVAGGDHLRSSFRVRAGAKATFAAQAAERFYRALDADLPASVRTGVVVESGAAAEWLPQESILFDRCALDRVLEVEVAAGAWFLGLESLVFGRAAMGEHVQRARLRDTIRVKRDGKLLLHDAIRLEGEVSARLARKAVADGGNAVATLVMVAGDAERHLDGLRAVWAEAQAGASVWNGMLVGRVVAQNGACLRAAIVAGLAVLRDGRKPPRVWMC